MQDPLEKRNLVEQERDRAKFFRKQLATLLDKGGQKQFAGAEEEPISAEVKQKLQDLVKF